MPQGDKKLKKPDRKTKTVRGDQQKLRKGSASLPLRATRVRSTYGLTPYEEHVGRYL